MHFSAQELRDIAAFYKTPSGAKALQLLPTVTAEYFGMLMPRMESFQSEIMAMTEQSPAEARVRREAAQSKSVRSARTSAPHGSRCGRAISPSTRRYCRPSRTITPGSGCTIPPNRCICSAPMWTASCKASCITCFIARPGRPATTVPAGPVRRRGRAQSRARPRADRGGLRQGARGGREPGLLADA